MVERVCAKFVSKKIRKVRWQRPAAYGHHNPQYFVTGSWDDEVSYTNYSATYFRLHVLFSFSFFLCFPQQNEVSLWNTNQPNEQNIDPVLVSTVPVSTDVNDIAVSCQNNIELKLIKK